MHISRPFKYPIRKIIALVLLFQLADSFSVAPLGLSGSYLPFGNYAKSGKSAAGVSWSRNLDGEIKLRRALCSNIPESFQYQYRYYNETDSCYKVGEQGPCGHNMIFYGFQTNAVYGKCDCNYNDNGRALVYDASEDKCHFIFTRGYCARNEWLAFDENWDVMCEPNKCLTYYKEHINSIRLDDNGPGGNKLQKAVSVEYVPYKGKCVPLGLSCEDKDKEVSKYWASLIHLPHQVEFVKGKLFPRCAPSKYIGWKFPTPKLQCLPGSVLHMQGNCTLAQFDL